MTKHNLRADARAQGKTTYFTGKPCKYGHIADRSAFSGNCLECMKDAHRKWQQNNPEKLRAYVQSHRERNQDQVREKGREYAAKRRAKLQAAKGPVEPRVAPNFAGDRWVEFVANYAGELDLSKAVYTGMNNNVEAVCAVHGVVQMPAKKLFHGAICPRCSVAARGIGRRLSLAEVIDRFVGVHGDRYDYTNVEYVSSATPVHINCPDHGRFSQAPEAHWAGSTCPECFHAYRRGAAQRDTLESFIGKLNQELRSGFDFTGAEYTNSQTYINIRCIAHGRLCTTKPNQLSNGYNPCPQCNHMKSRGEEEVFAHLAKFTPAIQRDRTILKPRELDIVAPDIKLAVEYCGMYWHSHGDPQSELKGRHDHYRKFTDCAAQGIRLVTLYETEWRDHQYAVRRLLRNAANKSKGKLMARKCTLRKVPHREAVMFYDKYHVQGGAGHGEHYGLYWGSKLVACMRFTQGANDRGRGAASRAWTLTRYATRVTVAGGASRLFKAFLTEYDPPEVKSFSDNRLFGGGMYEQLGFVAAEHSPPDYMVWSQKIGLRPKSHYQRRLLADRQRDHGMEPDFEAQTDPRTERDVTYELGARRIYDCGKTRWLWTRPDKPLAAAS